MSVSMKDNVDKKDLDKWFRVITLGIDKDEIIDTALLTQKEQRQTGNLELWNCARRCY